MRVAGFLRRPPPASPGRSGATAPGALRIEGVTKQYGPVRAVDAVSLTVEQGQFLTLLGPSGSGKTTLLMSIAGFVAPTAGQIRLGDRTITHLPPERRNFGMVFQGYALFPHLTVSDNVAFPLRIRGWTKADTAQAVARALDTVQMAHLATRLPRQLSGGQQQRIALARALVFAPSLVLLDEPLSALDKNLRTDLQTELRDLHRRVGLTFIYVTHDQQEALSMSDEVAIMRDGRLVQKGSPAALYERPSSRFVAGFLGRSNFLDGLVERTDPEAVTYRCGAFHLRHQPALQASLAGDPILLTIRPEKIRLLGPGDDAPNRVDGRLVSWTYLGNMFQLVADVAGIGRLSVDAPTWRCDPPNLGEAVVLGWDPDATVLLAA